MSTSQQNNGRGPQSGGNGEGRPDRGRRKRQSTARTLINRIFQAVGTLLLICVVTGCFLALYATFYVKTVIIPNSGLDLSQYTLNESSVIYYADGETGQYVELTTLYGDENRQWIDYGDIPKYFIDAAVAIEDERFWDHPGIDWRRTGRAVLDMFLGNDISGGSTITQQLIKNLTGQDDVTVKRKIGEIFNALEFEKNYEKHDIITWYLNRIYLGKKNYGIVTASRYYFGKEISEITLAEAAAIIAITNNPSIYGPASSAVVKTSAGEAWTSRQWNKYRQELILGKMLELGMISQKEHDQAVAQELDFVFDDEEAAASNVYSWYVEQVVSEVKDYLVNEQHVSAELAYDIVYGGGLAIYTPFDPRVQACVDEVYNNLDNLPYTSNDGQQMQSAITIVDNHTGHVVALAGQMGEKTGNLWQNYATQSPRQPGSSIKPLAGYSPAIEMGLITPATIIDDSPYKELDGKPWPRNDNGRYKGLTTVMAGITGSINTIATKLVAQHVTPAASYQFLTERYGITTLVDSMEINGKVKTDIDEAPLAMGGLTRGMTTYEMAAAYASFPRRGFYTEPTVVLRVETKDGQLIWDNTPESETVIKESTAWYMNTLLRSAANEGTGTGALVSGQVVAGKTGTTSENFDRWFAGYTNYYTGVVWTGYPYNAKMRTQGNPASALWKKVMTLVHGDLERQDFFKLENTVTASICLDCGQLASENCANDIRTVIGTANGEIVNRTASFVFAPGDAPTGYCTCHISIAICKESPVLGADGAPTGAYHLAGAFCPKESVAMVYIVDHKRGEAASSVAVEDMPYMKTYYEGLEISDCTVHTTTSVPDFPPFDWSTFDPYDLSTWPFDPYSDPDTWPFDPYDSSTWPMYGGSGQPSVPPVEPTGPIVTPEPPPTQSPSQEPVPTESPSQEPTQPLEESPQPSPVETDELREPPPLGVDYIPAGR